MSPRAGRTMRRAFLALVLLGAMLPAAYAGVRSAASPNAATSLRLAATDGHIQLPGLDPVKFPDGLYVFGFSGPVPRSFTMKDIVKTYKGNVQFPAPIIWVDQESDVTIRIANAGFLARPDLDDAHTLHWHGFRNQIALFDGVPEVSIGVKALTQFPYFYRPHDPGTYMYHCHFEDVEHVQMGMQGSIFVRPIQNSTGAQGGAVPVARLGGNTDPSAPMGYVYNDGDGSTAYDREFALLLDELWTTPHWNGEHVQESVWTDYDPEYYTINGRAYPDTVKPHIDASLPEQPVSGLIQANGGEKVLLRLSNLGYQQAAMQLPGITMHVVGEDATLLRGPEGADLSYDTNTIYIGPGESRDVIFDAPAFDASLPISTDAHGDYNTYLFMNRNLNHATNPGLSGLGGQVTEVRVYQDDLPDQAEANELFLP
jgi:FtsP/CotA-like multicopper oxidase with cupredoxin domain